MFLGYLGSLLFEGKIDEFMSELEKIPIAYDDIRIIKGILDALASKDSLSLFYKLASDEHEVEKEQRVKELVSRLERSIKILEKIKGESDKILIKRYRQLIELLGASVAHEFFEG